MKKILLSILLLLVARMFTTKYIDYGLIAGNLQIKNSILLACHVISPNTSKEASLLIAETIAVESNNGNVRDFKKKWGEGLTQFDKGTFIYIQDRYKNHSLQEKILFNCLVNIKTAQYEDLRKSPMLSIVFARLLYYSIPKPLPNDLEDRWTYYKKYFNSSEGATTREKYMKAQKMAVIKV